MEIVKFFLRSSIFMTDSFLNMVESNIALMDFKWKVVLLTGFL